jgi:serine/threonine-protein kinase HipA
MRKAEILQLGVLAAYLTETAPGKFRLEYLPGYNGRPISLMLPVRSEPYDFDKFPPFFEGLLPEGPQLEALLRVAKIDRNDLMGQLLAVGRDVVGSVQIIGVEKASSYDTEENNA